MAILSIPAMTSGSAAQLADVAQLQLWAQKTDLALNVLSNEILRLNNKIIQLLKLNGLKSP